MSNVLVSVEPYFSDADSFHSHLHPGKLQVYVLHGQNRKSIHLVELYDIVITTYQTVASIWRKRSEESKGADAIFSLKWHRIILDEGRVVFRYPSLSSIS